MIATYIQELLATNNRVIVPNYGAFLVRATSKSKDANTLEEKLKDIYFSPFLKFNDELLEKYIIKKENVTKEQASEKITTFINDIKKELDLEKPFIIEEFGQFVSDKQGKVQFLTVAKHTTETPSDQTSKKEEKKEVEKPAKTSKPSVSKKTPVEKTTPTEEIKEEKSKVSETKTGNTIDKKEEQKQESKPASSADKLKEFKPETKTPAASTSTEPKPQPVTNQTKSIYSAKKQKKPMNKGLILSIAIGLPLAAIFIWGLLNFNTVKTVFKKEEPKTEKVAKQKPADKARTQKAKPVSQAEEKETIGTDETKKSEIKPARSTSEKSATPQKKYYIIAGSFKNEKYALSYMNKLKAEGYNAEKLAERNGMHAVSYDSFTNKKEAIAEYKLLANEKGLQTWILYH
jgi:nucleoid DNA-binding protein